MVITKKHIEEAISESNELFERSLKKENKYRYVRTGVSLCVRKEGRVLLHKRKGTHAGGTWAFSGGHVEKWETWEECALRETKEEAGDIEVTTPYFWTALNTMFPDEGRHYTLICMVADWISGEPEVKEPDKCECWEWHSWDNLPSPLMQGLQMLKDQGMNPFG